MIFNRLDEQERHQQREIVAITESSRKKNGNMKALIIGISKYDHNNKFRDLEFCENDANEVYKILKDQRVRHTCKCNVSGKRGVGQNERRNN